jgi:hypothetical protein
MATGWVGRIASRLVRAPVTLLKIGNEVRKSVLHDSTVLRLSGKVCPIASTRSRQIIAS